MDQANIWIPGKKINVEKNCHEAAYIIYLWMEKATLTVSMGYNIMNSRWWKVFLQGKSLSLRLLFSCSSLGRSRTRFSLLQPMDVASNCQVRGEKVKDKGFFPRCLDQQITHQNTLALQMRNRVPTGAGWVQFTSS